MRTTLLVALVCALVLAMAPGPALSGVEPSSFQPEINQLGAITNILDSNYMRFDRILLCDGSALVPLKVSAWGDQIFLAGDMLNSFSDIYESPD